MPQSDHFGSRRKNKRRTLRIKDPSEPPFVSWKEPTAGAGPKIYLGSTAQQSAKQIDAESRQHKKQGKDQKQKVHLQSPLKPRITLFAPSPAL